ncbi:MAG TPA: tyrosine-type recombinase/integrase [Stellaceae bacterium]|nr:tyrosine-type recombinase/integrase [Stellaceae bacterium]
MARLKLTDKHIKRMAAPTKGRLQIFDTDVKGLVFRITAERKHDDGTTSGAVRSFSLVYRFGGKKYRLTLGTVDKGMELVDARGAARDALELVRKGINPVEAKRRAAAQLVLANARTFTAVSDLYIKRHLTQKRPKTQKETKRILEVDVKPAWGERPISSITRADVRVLLGNIGSKRRGNRAKHGGKVQANRTLTRLNTLFAWAVEHGYLDVSPVAGMKTLFKEEPRDRTLTDEEIAWFWKACEQLQWPWRQIFELLLLTAQRRNEVGMMDWRELDLDQKQWTIPPEKAKNNKAHIVALSAPAIEILKQLKEGAGSGAKGFVFTTDGKKPASAYGRAKSRLDAKIEIVARKDRGLPEKDDDLRKALKLKAGDPLPRYMPEFVLHDLRRTATTGMARLKVPPHVADKVLNHTGGKISGVAAIYNKFEYLDERRDALEIWGRYVLALMEPKKSNVVRFQR